MAGNGPPPKVRKVRRNADTVPSTVLRFERAEAPELPDFRIERDGDLVEFVWPERTREWRPRCGSERSVERWRRAWRERGETGLLSLGSPGRPKLSEIQFARL
ncbi:hypothetical protein AB0D34_08250 [Streptomyces sp. NPDC048420]|uniref:hypothetical protein n=1 Tax=Streptomyces sp. NPDC048420 TaxID=3155755 RepID=UPI003427EB13